MGVMIQVNTSTHFFLEDVFYWCQFIIYANMDCRDYIRMDYNIITFIAFVQSL